MRRGWQPCDRARDAWAAIAKELVGPGARSGGGAQVDCHEYQATRADSDYQSSSGQRAPCVLRAQPAVVRATVVALVATRAEHAVMALDAREVAPVFASLAGGLAPGTWDCHHWRNVKVDVRSVALEERDGGVNAVALVVKLRPVVTRRHVDGCCVAASDRNAHVVAVTPHAVRRRGKRLQLDLVLAADARAFVGGRVALAALARRARLAVLGVLVVSVAFLALDRPEPRRGRQRRRLWRRCVGW